MHKAPLFLFTFLIPTFVYNMEESYKGLSFTEKLFIKAVKAITNTLTVSDETLFDSEKPIEIIQNPTTKGTIQQQTNQIINAVATKLGRQGMSLEDITRCTWYVPFYNNGKLASQVLKENYPLLYNKSKIAVQPIHDKHCNVIAQIFASKSKKKAKL